MENSPTFQVNEIIENEDGTATVKVEVTDDFKEWFKKEQGLQRWSEKRFEKWFSERLRNHVADQELPTEEESEEQNT